MNDEETQRPSAHATAGALPITVVDLETLGRDPNIHKAWEVGALRRDLDGTLRELEVQIAVSDEEVALAEPKALEVGGFHERYDPLLALTPLEVWMHLCHIADGTVLMAVNSTFDVGFITPAIHAVDLEATWHYSPMDIKSFAAGALGLEPPFRSEALADGLGIRQIDFARHSALGDCYYGLAMFDAALTISRAR